MKNLASFRQFREEGLVTEWGDTLQALRVPGSPPQNGGDTLALSGNAPTPLNYTPNDLKDPRVIDDINNHLERKLDDAFLTPYIGLERMRKVLHPYGIVIPAVTWLNGDEGDKVFAVNQYSGFGDLTSHANYVVYMSWSYVPDKSCYDIYAAVVTLDQLDSLLATDNDGTPFDDQDVEEDEMVESADRHAELSDHTKSVFHKTLTTHGYVHSKTKHKAGYTGPKDNDSTEHVYTHPDKGKSHVVVTQYHAKTGAYKTAAHNSSYIHRHEQSNGIMSPSHGESKNQLEKTLARHSGISEETKKPTAKEKHEAAIAKLLAYAPHITREQAIKQIGYDKELDKQAKAKSKMQRGVFGIK